MVGKEEAGMRRQAFFARKGWFILKLLHNTGLGREASTVRLTLSWSQKSVDHVGRAVGLLSLNLARSSWHDCSCP